MDFRARLLSIPLFLAAMIGIESSAAPVNVFVSIPPHQYLVERIGGEHVNVHVLIDPGEQPNSFEPSPRQVVELAGARVFFSADLPFENRLLGKIEDTHKHLKLVDLTQGIDKVPITRHSHHEDEAEHNHEAHGDLDPHVWLSPPLLKTQARNIAETLQNIDPSNRETYARNLQNLLNEIDKTHRDMKESLEPFRGESFHVFHPAFGYFADAYGLEQRPVEIGGKTPTPKQLLDFIQKAKQEEARIIFVQPQFDRRAVETIAEAIDGSVATMDPLAKNVLENLREMAAKIKNASSASRE